MGERFLITSRDPEAFLTLRPHNSGYFLADLTHLGISASVRVGTYLAHGLGDYFAQFAANWRGWDGERTWSSLEEELTLSATCDRTGHVYLHARLRRGAPAQWEVGAELVLEAGQLERLARDAQAFADSTLTQR